MKKNIMRVIYTLVLVAVFVLTGCSKGQSYSELLRDEEKATNWYLSNQRVVAEIPKDSVFETGEDAPYYRMDDDGFIYMQVINPGTKENKAKYNQMIYFRYMRANVKAMYEGQTLVPVGNADDMENRALSFRFDNFNVESSATYGMGIQLPLRYLGVDCEVNLIIRSYYGFSTEQSQCIPFLYYKVRYFKAEY